MEKKQKKLSPIEKLRADRIEFKKEAEAKKQNITELITYTQSHVGSILLATGHNMIFAKKKKREEEAILAGKQSSNSPIFDITTYEAWIEKKLPVLWEIAKPLLTSYLIQKAQNILFKKILTKKK